MKKLLFVLVLFIVSNTYSQTKYVKGFETGYAKGYCYNDSVGCIPPLTPIAPIPRVGESSNNYNDGYNRGFAMGRNKRRNESKSNTPSKRSTGSSGTVTTSRFTPINDTGYYEALAANKAENIYKSTLHYKNLIDKNIKVAYDVEVAKLFYKAENYLNYILNNKRITIYKAENNLKAAIRDYKKAIRLHNRKIKKNNKY